MAPSNAFAKSSDNKSEVVAANIGGGGHLTSSAEAGSSTKALTDIEPSGSNVSEYISTRIENNIDKNEDNTNTGNTEIQPSNSTISEISSPSMTRAGDVTPRVANSYPSRHKSRINNSSSSSRLKAATAAVPELSFNPPKSLSLQMANQEMLSASVPPLMSPEYKSRPWQPSRNSSDGLGLDIAISSDTSESSSTLNWTLEKLSEEVSEEENKYPKENMKSCASIPV